MAFKFPSSNWQEPSGFEKSSEGSECCVCGSTYDIGLGWKRTTDQAGLHVCKNHSKCTLPAIERIIECKILLNQISTEEFKAGRWNSYDRDSMLPYFSNELLISSTEFYLTNASHFKFPASTYDEAIQLFAKELANRLKQLI